MPSSTAYLTRNKVGFSIVIPQTNVFIANPTAEQIFEFYGKDADPLDWSGKSIKSQVAPASIDGLTDKDVAGLFGEIIHARS